MANLLQEASTSTAQPRQPGRPRKAPQCHACEKPMKGHNRAECQARQLAMQQASQQESTINNENS